MIKLQPGDVFFTRNPMAIGRIINFIQKFWSADNESTFSHAGIVTSQMGGTFEALSTIRRSSIEDYVGDVVAVYRHKDMTRSRFRRGMATVGSHEGQWYPAYRLPLMIIPPVGKYLSFWRVVCSELAGKFLTGAGFNVYWRGLNPDNLHDFMKRSKDYNLIYWGKVQKNTFDFSGRIEI